MKENSFLINLFARLNGENIHYSVLRNYELLPKSCGGSDLDLWVAEKDIERCILVLQNVARKTGAYLVSYTSGDFCPKYCFLSVDEGVQIDLFKGVIICKGKTLFEEDVIIKYTKDYNGIKVLDDRLGDLMALLKEILNNGRCDQKYISPLYENKEAYDVQYFNRILTVFSNVFRNAIYEAIVNENIEEVTSVLTKLGRKDLRITGRGNVFQKAVNLKRIFKPTGYTVAVLGTDGSGKSFIINSITPILNEAFHKGVKYEHMRPNLIPSIAVLTGRKDKNERVEVCSNPHASKPSGFIGSLVRLSYYWIDYTWGYFRKVYLDKTFKSHVWIFDRYYYDYYIDQTRSGIKLPSWIVKFYGLSVPSPDITICLGGDPQKIYERKPETSLEEVQRQTYILKKFAESHKATVWVDTTVKPEESISASMRYIVDMMGTRYKDTVIL